MPAPVRWRLSPVLAAATTLACLLPVGGTAQDSFRQAAVRCSPESLSSTPAPVCLEAVTTYSLLRGALISGMAGGAPTPGTASTLGQRIPGSPRVAVGGGLVMQRVAVPALAREFPTGVGPLPEASGNILGLKGNVTVGVFQGFSTGPTMGGILAADAIASAGWLFLPGSVGFADGGVPAWGLGARLGILRESFTVPGISLSGVWHGTGEVDFGPDQGAQGLALAPRGLSMRAVIGKDLAGVGLHAGAGWNRNTGRLTVDRNPVGVDLASYRGSVEASRNSVLFAGATWTNLVFQLSGEVGWVGGEESMSGRPPRSVDPGKGRMMGQVQGRIIL